jgi:nucleoside-diphosphate-sugar epimerase
MMNTTIGITGCEGYLGSALQVYLAKAQKSFVGFSHKDGDITDVKSIERIFGDASVSTVIHLAGLTGVDQSWSSSAEFYRVNALGTQCVADFCLRHSARLILVSSYLYGGCQVGAVNEETPLEATNPYMHSKALAEEICKFYKTWMGLDVVIIRPSNVYGGNQKSTFLVPFLIDQAKGGETDCVIARDHRPVRDFIYLKDVLSGLCHVLDYHGDEYIFNLGTGKGYSVQEVATLIIELWGPGKRFVSLGDERKNEIDVSVMSIERVTSETGWVPQYSLRQGLMDMCSKP